MTRNGAGHELRACRGFCGRENRPSKDGQPDLMIGVFQGVMFIDAADTSADAYLRKLPTTRGQAEMPICSKSGAYN